MPSTLAVGLEADPVEARRALGHERHRRAEGPARDDGRVVGRADLLPRPAVAAHLEAEAVVAHGHAQRDRALPRGQAADLLRAPRARRAERDERTALALDPHAVDDPPEQPDAAVAL